MAAALQALKGEGPRLMSGRAGALLADEVGMGKTWEALATAALYLASHTTGRRAAFLLPPGLIQKWQEEIRLFCKAAMPGIKGNTPLKKVLKAMGRAADGEKSSIRLFPTSKAGKLTRGKLPGWVSKLDLLVLDEAHKARKCSTQLSRALQRIRDNKKTCPFLFLSATPFQCDSRQELIHLLHFLDLKYEPDFELISDLKAGGKMPLQPSIVNAIKYSLKLLDTELDKLIKDGDPRTIKQEFKELLNCIDINFDAPLDPTGRTFGVEVGHRAQDGLDEYLRALVIRNTKPKVEEHTPSFKLEAADTALYLFGRAYLRQNAHAKYGQFDDEPPPGGKFLPNGYSRLCSAHAALHRGKFQAAQAHPHKKIIKRFNLKEGKVDELFSGWTHAKVRVLIERVRCLLLGNGKQSQKVVVFFNHLSTIAKAQKTLLEKRNGIVCEFEGKPLLAGKKKPIKNNKVWRKAQRILNDAGINLQSLEEMFVKDCEGLEFEERVCIHDALVRGIMRFRGSGYPDLIKHWKEVLKRISEDFTREGGERISVRQMRARLRGFISKPENTPKYNKLIGRLPFRQYGIVEKFTGESSRARRTRVLEAFNSTGVPPHILLVSQIGGEGLDMQKACSNVIHHDLHWNPTVIEQRTGRIYRDLVKGTDITMELLKYPGGYDDRIWRYAKQRQAYKDFILGEKQLGAFVQAIAESEGFPSPKSIEDTKEYGWEMDLTPPRILP
ncbi:MAG: hypothetical protein A2117_01355 [Candidatus Wildermuthbacteria bacterium GWA2_46_15]|uniref:Helicase n=1 Tax=Candidatus Wildermuthbacteria bacterium GWA2_46_15 TaxID=1802443 RepID=A0A1G2QQ41_9BACT|nr:MAG: hypothetical protein A2117_01355 [Candidatus Wildermuthbacteria bacterium GWA2_46_15]